MKFLKFKKKEILNKKKNILKNKTSFIECHKFYNFFDIIDVLTIHFL